MRQNNLAVAIHRAQYDLTEADCARLAEEERIQTADTSHLDHKRIKERIEHRVRETDKAVLLRLGHWRCWIMETWLPKSQIEFITDDYVLIPVWLAKEKR